ncbi:OmpA family protein [Leptobacterium flavescens]|uniref:OmpA family protein n=1 Tax=Leptobacterium flavescens TaxID=472055 RepID=A0A6P0UPW3_9FLAO|nr:OmpA family protein [Leptobacterium flavescens]NER14018.1 OmpA family protein [Leptobacterium flavescens]
MKKLFLLLLCCYQGLSQQAINFSLYYDTGVYELNEQQKAKIKHELSPLKALDISKIDIKGYADYIDTNEYNKELSFSRATAVYQYLSVIVDTLNTNIRKKGFGELFSKEKLEESGNSYDRRVDITVFYQGVEADIPIIDSLFLGIPVRDIHIGDKIEIKNLYFFRGRTKMYDYSTSVLDSIGSFLQRNRGFKIEVQGHVCCGGDDPGDVINIDTKTKTLSVDRARTIYEYLINFKNIHPDRISYKGFGFSSPRAWPEETVEDEKRNRRVEIMIVDF